MSDDSPRPVQNKVIKKYVDERLEAISANLDSMDKTLDQVTEMIKKIQENQSESKLIYF